MGVNGLSLTLSQHNGNLLKLVGPPLQGGESLIYERERCYLHDFPVDEEITEMGDLGMVKRRVWLFECKYGNLIVLELLEPEYWRDEN